MVPSKEGESGMGTLSTQYIVRRKTNIHNTQYDANKHTQYTA